MDAGVIAALGGSVLIKNSNFTNNFATDRGGVVLLSETSTILTNVVIRDSHTMHSSAFRGGSIYASASTLLLDGVHCHNSTGSEGYFLYLSTCETTIIKSHFSDGVGADGIVVKSQPSIFYMTESSIVSSKYV